MLIKLERFKSFSYYINQDLPDAQIVANLNIAICTESPIRIYAYTGVYKLFYFYKGSLDVV